MRPALRHAVKRMINGEPSPDWLLVSDIDDTLAGDDEGIAAFSKHCRGVRLGTEVQLEGALQTGWTARFAGWDRGAVDRVMARAGMRPHAEAMQTPYKASFAVPRGQWKEMMAAVRAALPQCRIITSGGSANDENPALGGKDHATRGVAGRLGIAPARLIVAGDSGNDLAMFLAADRAIAVGNARAELLERADPVRTYFAKATRAWGLIEGLRHWGAIR